MKLDDGTREAVYEVTGPLPADITYEKVAPDSAAQTVSVEARKTALPWSATVDVPEDVDSLRLTVTSVDTENEADFSCRILVDGRKWRGIPIPCTRVATPTGSSPTTSERFDAPFPTPTEGNANPMRVIKAVPESSWSPHSSPPPPAVPTTARRNTG
ncbi:hypothetical protein NKH77_27310 [Streptomyces sp. M19]